MEYQLISHIDSIPSKLWETLGREGTVFHQREFIESQCATSPEAVQFFLAKDGDDVVAFLPLLVRRVLFFRYAVLFVEPWIQEGASLKLAEVLCNFFLEDKGFMWIDANSTMARFGNVEGSHVRRAPFGSYVIDLTRPEDEIWSKIHSKHKNSIRSAEKNNVVVEIIQKIDDIYPVLDITHKMAGLPLPSLSEFRGLWEELLQKNKCRLYAAKSHGVVQGAVLIPFTKQRAYYYYGGSIENHVPGSMNLLHWEVVKDLKKTGVLKYDFGGARVNPDRESKAYGIQRFKERFGGEFETCFIWEKINNLLLFKLFKWAKRISFLCRNKTYHASLVEQEISRGAILMIKGETP